MRSLGFELAFLEHGFAELMSDVQCGARMGCEMDIRNIFGDGHDCVLDCTDLKNNLAAIRCSPTAGLA